MMTLSKLAWALALVAMPSCALAQAEQTTAPSEAATVATDAATPEQTGTPTTLEISTKGRDASTYTITDFSVYLTKGYEYEGQVTGSDLSVSLSLTAPLDDAMLQWIKPASGPKSLRDAKVTVTAQDENGEPVEMIYELGGARVTSFSGAHYSYAPTLAFSLSISAKNLSVNGVPLN